MVFKFNAADVAIIIQQALQAKRDILLVKETGLFLMPDCRLGDGIESHICYAEGCDPNGNSSSLRELNRILGGSDACEHFKTDRDNFFTEILENKYHLGIEFINEKTGEIKLSGLWSLDD